MADESPERAEAKPTSGYQAMRARIPANADEKVFTWPYLVQIELVGALLYLLLLSLMSMFIQAPLTNLANPEVTPNPSKAPWYFLGLQELLLHMHPSLAGVIVPGAVLLGLAAIPYFDSRRAGTGIWFSTPKGVPITVFAAIYTFLWDVGLVVIDEFLRWSNEPGAPHGIAAFTREVLGWPSFIGEITIPVFLMIFIPWSLAYLVRRRYQADTRETVIALFTFFVTSFLVLTVIGTAFRGHSMALMWPWEVTAPVEH